VEEIIAIIDSGIKYYHEQKTIQIIRHYQQNQWQGLWGKTLLVSKN
jgi:hypothetical protein